MSISSDKHNYLTIQLLSYDKPGNSERFYFMEMSTLQATTILNEEVKISSAQITAYTADNNYLEEEEIKDLKTIGLFNSFFLHHPEYYIHNCDMELENGVSIHSHDDGEVSIQFENELAGYLIIEALFNKFKIDSTLISLLKNKPGYYIAIDSGSNIIGQYKNFDEYLEKGRN